MGEVTEISVTSDHSPSAFALQTAARNTLNAGYEQFSVIRGEGAGKSYVMLIKMVPLSDTVSTAPNTYDARMLLAFAG